jgi:WD40 repeat protein
MSSPHIFCSHCGFANDPGMEHCHRCSQPLFGKISNKSVPQLSIPRSRLSRRTILWGVAAGTAALSTGGYLVYRRLTDTSLLASHLLTYAENQGGIVGGVLDVAWSPDGMRVASVAGVDDGAVQIWNATTGEKLSTCKLEQPVPGGLPALSVMGPAAGKRVVWSADGKYILAFVGPLQKPIVQVWNAANGHHVRSFPVTQSLTLPAKGDGGDQLRVTAWALNARYLAVAKQFILSGKPFVEIWDIAAGSKISTLDPTSPDPGASFRQYHRITWAPDEKNVVLGCSTEKGEDSEIWDVTSGKSISAFKMGDTTTMTAWSPDGKFLAAGTVAYDAETGHKVTTYPVAWTPFSLAWSPDGKRVAVASYRGERYWVPTYGSLSVFDASSGKQLAQYDQGRFDIAVSGMGQIAWSPNGKYLLVLNGHIDLWRMAQK